MPLVQGRERRRVAARRALVTRRRRWANELDALGVWVFRASTRGFVQVGETGAVVPWRAGGGGIVSGYRNDAPPAARGSTGASTRTAGTPQC
jgi:hypothetical protein